MHERKGMESSVPNILNLGQHRLRPRIMQLAREIYLLSLSQFACDSVVLQTYNREVTPTKERGWPLPRQGTRDAFQFCHLFLSM